MNAVSNNPPSNADKVVLEEKARPAPPAFSVWITAATFLLLYVPLIVVVISSFRTKSPADPAWTLEWYTSIFNNSALIESLWMSLWVAIGATIGSSVIGTLAALGLERTQFKGKMLFDGLNLIPLVMPEIVMGLSLLMWFVFLQLSLGLVSMILAHITFCLSFVIITVRARLADFDSSMEEAARDLGANAWQTFWRVTFPLIWPGILSGGLMAFTLSFDDFLISYFTAGVGGDTLPIKLYSLIKYGMNPTISAISTLILVGTIAIVLIGLKPKTQKIK